MTTRVPNALTEEEAMQAYRAVVGHLNDTFGEHLVAADRPVRQGEGDTAWYTGPALVEDFSMWHSETAWAVVWEASGIDDWPLSVPTDLVPGVGIGAFCSFAVSLYRETPIEVALCAA